MEPNKRTVGGVFAALGKALCYLLLFLGCQSLVSLGYTLVITLYAYLNPGITIDPLTLIFSCTDQISLISGLLTLVILALFFLLRHKNPLKESGVLATRWRYVARAAAATPLLQAAVSLVLGLLPEEWMESYAEASAPLNQTGVLMVIATVVIAPVVEELIFRGLILSRLARAMPSWLAALLSSLVFGLCHAQAVWIAYAFVMGLIFSYMTLSSRSIWPSLAAHFLFNALGQLSVYLPETEAAGMGFFLALVAAGVVLSGAVALYCFRCPLNPGKECDPHE